MSLEQLPLLEDRVHVQGAVKIGSGNLGTVVLMNERKGGGRRLAVKVISLKQVRDNGCEEARVWKEVQVLRDLDHHPNLVRLVDVLASWNRVPHVTSDPPYVCIAMEYVVDSEPLSNALRRTGPSVPLAAQVLPQLADALALMHRIGLVHRDIWSENVLVSERTGRAVLVDLGCAEYSGTESAVNSKLNIPYMSPEAAQGLRQAPADDCWAVGLLLGEMLTGRFVADRLGRSDLPIHYNPQALSEMLQEAAVKGGPIFGKLCQQLLDGTPERRPSMMDVVRQCRKMVLAFSGASAIVAQPLRLATAMGGSTAPASATSVACLAPSGRSKSFFPPQRSSMSSPASQASTLVPSSASHMPPAPPAPAPDASFSSGAAGGLSPSTGGGSSTEVAAESQPVGPAAATALSVRPQVVPRPRPQNVVQHAILVGQVPKGGQALQLRLEQGPVVVPRRAAEGTPASAASSSSVVVTPNGAGAGASCTTAGPPGSSITSAGGSTSGIAPAMGSPSPKRAAGGGGAATPTLAAGMRVAYTARSNGLAYLGTLVGRAASGTGWHVTLDVGEKKDVDDAEAWRLTPMVVGKQR